jgi:hypothetical protein
MKTVLLAIALLGAAAPAAADPQISLYFGRATGGKDVDIARLAYRLPLAPDSRWWWPTHVQLGASAWSVPDISGTTHRLDANATAIWRAERAWGYFEGGFGPYFLSHTISTRTTSLPSELQFGSHIAVGLNLAPHVSIGVGLQHISNAGIEQPNGGIDFVLLTANFRL